MIRPDFHRNFLMNILIVEFEWEMEHLMWYVEKDSYTDFRIIGFR